MEDQIYLEIGFGTQTQILKLIKEQSGLSWETIAQILGIKKRMLFFYLKERNRLPIYRLNKLCEDINFDLKKITGLKTVKMKNFEQKPIQKAKLNEKLSEFLGALSGDGNVDPKNNRICIGCDAITDYDYVTQTVYDMFSTLFHIETTIKIEKSTVYCQVYSKELADYLQTLGFIKRNRKNKTTIPNEICQNKKLLIAFLRGVFDTDGSIHRKRKTSAVVEYINCSPNFLLQIKEALQKLGLRATSYGKSVYIYDQKEVDTFFNLIKPKNLKHCIKYAVFKETGKVPLHKEMINAFVM